MKRPALLGTFVAGMTVWTALHAAPQSWTLTRTQWAGVQSPRQIVALDPVRNAVNALAADPGARLAVVHNGGEDGVFWASDLEGWLISLGVPAARIEDRAGAVAPGELHLELETSDSGPLP